jgi:glycosyltransferase involved in cell wall biosynthesis
MKKYVFVQNRARDGFEVPLALYEEGMLSEFVVDYYAPTPFQRILPSQFKRRRKEGLPASATKIAWLNFFLQYLGEFCRLPMQAVFRASDWVLGEVAMRRAKKLGSSLYAYSSYLHRRPKLLPGAKVIDFEYHPNQNYAIEILRKDFERYPQVAWSMRMEEAAFDKDRNHDSWRFADAVVCASGMTKRSLEFAGCPPEKITIIPYGVDSTSKLAARRSNSVCEFLFVGQGISRKGLHHLAQAWRNVNHQDARLTVVSYRIDPGIEADLGQPGVRLLGRQSRAELDRLFSSADVFVMPSLVEGFGLVYLEALQEGCHVLGTNNTGLPDLELSADAVSLIACGDVDALSSMLNSLIQRKKAGHFDPVAIQAEVKSKCWSQFRRNICTHARGVIGE